MSFINNQNPHRQETTTPAELHPFEAAAAPAHDTAPAFKMKPSHVFGVIFGK